MEVIIIVFIDYCIIEIFDDVNNEIKLKHIYIEIDTSETIKK